MCGIIATFHYGDKKQSVNGVAINIMQDQLTRGEEGFGAVFINEKNKFTVERSTGQLKILVDSHFNPCKMMILHHRQPSSSDNKISQTHPIEVEHESLKYGYLVIHNGIIRNDKELKADHESQGFKYTTDDQTDKRFNDSECLAIEMAKFIEDKNYTIKAIGSCAFVALQYDKKTKTALQIFYGRNTNPLKLAKSRDFLYLSSDGKGEDIKVDTLYSFNLKDFNIKKREMKMKSYELATQRTGVSANIPDDDFDTCKYNKVQGFKDNSDIDTVGMVDWEMEQTVDENKETIVEELDTLFDELKDKEKVLPMDLNEKLKNLVAVLMLEISDAYRISTNFFADALMNEAREMEEEARNKVQEDLEGKLPVAIEFDKDKIEEINGTTDENNGIHSTAPFVSDMEESENYGSKYHSR